MIAGAQRLPSALWEAPAASHSLVNVLSGVGKFATGKPFRERREVIIPYQSKEVSRKLQGKCKYSGVFRLKRRIF